MPSIGFHILTLVIAISILVAVPFLLVFSAPFYLIRIIVAALAKLAKPNFGKMVTCRGAAFTVDDLNRPKSTVSIPILLEGNVDVPAATNLIQKRLFEKARLPNGDLKYPELKQYMFCWMGYHFWKEDLTFDIRNHIRIHEKCKGDEDHFTPDDIEEFRNELLNRTWSQNRSLWDITFIPNCYPEDVSDPGSPHTLMILRHHHSMGDGYSWLPLLIRDICQAEIKFPAPNYVQRPLCSKILYVLGFPFRMSYDLAKVGATAMRNMPFRVTKSDPNWKHYLGITGRIPMSKLKTIRRSFKVSFSSVIFSTIGGATRQFLLDKGTAVPCNLQAAIAQPLPGHTDKLRNFMTGTIINFPTGESDPIQRLGFSNSDLEDCKRSTLPEVMGFFYMLSGVFPSFILQHMVNNFVITSGMSNFAGAPQPISFQGLREHKWIEHTFAVGLQAGSAGLAFTSVSYVDDFRITVICDSSILRKEEVREMTGLIEREVDLLYKLALANDV